MEFTTSGPIQCREFLTSRAMIRFPRNILLKSSVACLLLGWFVACLLPLLASHSYTNHNAPETYQSGGIKIFNVTSRVQDLSIAVCRNNPTTTQANFLHRYTLISRAAILYSISSSRFPGHSICHEMCRKNCSA